MQLGELQHQKQRFDRRQAQILGVSVDTPTDSLAMMERLGLTFDLLSDPDRAAMKDVLALEGITWRSWWDEGRIDGPIHKQWQVLERPSIHLLDAKGVVRFRNITEEEIDAAVEKLVAEAEKK